jgi:hypothetical protein
MSILKKGILGCPQGRMANIQCYRRKGVDIIQRPSIPKNPGKRRWNLYQQALLSQFLILINKANALTKSRWLLYFDNFQNWPLLLGNLNLQYASRYYENSLSNMFYIPPSNCPLNLFDASYNVSTRVLTIKRNFYYETYFKLSNTRIVVQRVAPNGNLILLVNVEIGVIESELNVQLPVFNENQADVLVFALSISTPFRVSARQIIDYKALA